MTFADCAVVPDPTAAQICGIASSAARLHAAATDEEPRVALLSFSTNGSAEHPKATKMREALRLLRQTHPQLLADGEMQLDVALSPDVARRKFPQSLVAGHANVLIFPDLDSANIGYKLAERLAGARATGCFVLGLGGPNRSVPGLYNPRHRTCSSSHRPHGPPGRRRPGRIPRVAGGGVLIP